ncbi:MAG TPA: glycosyltransferase family 39 protein, partial [Polyangiales bacterium]|nr:glycosyltransferase family 39 protein [Polyangiales bacterium]
MNEAPSKATRLLLSALGVLCATGSFLLMSREGQLAHGALFGFLMLLAGLVGLFAGLGVLKVDATARPLSETAWSAHEGEPTWAAPRVTAPIALALVALCAKLLGGHALPYAILLALALLLVSALRRPGLFVFVAASAMYLPQLGAYGLWDPWETHYGEVSREILSRDDWISLWWAQDQWFWSKPILIFWSEALTWSAAGLGFKPDVHAAHTEWVLRIPIYLMSITGLCSVYGAISRVFSKRAGVLAALVLATTPYYAMLTHQAITDMPFVANMTVATMLLTLGLIEDPERHARPVRVFGYGLSAQHATIALVTLIGLPQVLYLASRNITFVDGLFAWHRDEFMSGSGWNPSVPGNVGIQTEHPALNALWWQPLSQALVWLVALALILDVLRRETRLAQLYMFAFYAFCALAFMAKGIPGFALPGLVAFLVLLATRRFSMLFSGQLRVATGMLIVVTLGMPWFVAMYMRHGPAFTDRILIHDHINRLTSGVHGDNGTIQYFIWQLGYGMFPWIALLPAALGSWLLDRGMSPALAGGEAPQLTAAKRAQRDTLFLLGLWFATAFTLFSAMTTKFHHYIFPAVPPAAMLIGLLLDRMIDGAQQLARKRQLAVYVAAGLAPLPLVLGVAGLRGNVRGVLPAYVTKAARDTWAFQHGWSGALCWALIIAGLLLFVFAVRATREASGEHVLDRFAQAAVAVAMIAGAVLVTFVGRDMSWNTSAPPPGSERLIHLFVYNYTRPWPDQFDYRPILSGFACVAVLLVLASASQTLRRAAVMSLLGLGFTLTVWSLDVYMVDLAPHWSQAELVDRYYAERKSAKEPLIAWQMNWKGENFYTGNRVFVFVDLDNKKLEEWIKGHKGTHAFFVLEHVRLDRLKRLLSPREVKSLTTMR